MKLRSASLRDLVRVEQIYREAEAGFSAVPPPARLWGLVSHTFAALLPLYQETLICVAEDEGRVIGFIQATGHPLTVSLPAKISSLQVLNLCVASGAEESVKPRAQSSRISKSHRARCSSGPSPRPPCSVHGRSALAWTTSTTQ